MTDQEKLPSSEAELNAELNALLRRYHSNGFDVKGGLECQNDAEYPDWDVIITEVQKIEDS